MTEEQIVERLAQIIAAEVWGTHASLYQDHVDRSARAVLALLGPAPLVWEGDWCATSPLGGDYTIAWQAGTGDWWLILPDGDGGSHESHSAAKAAAEAHHRLWWFAATALAQEGKG